MIGLPPGLRGFVAADQLREQKNAQMLGALSSLVGMQGALSQQAMSEKLMPLKMRGLELGNQETEAKLGANTQQQAALSAFASTLPEGERTLFLANPSEYIKERNKKYTVGRNLVTGAGQPVFTAPQDPQRVSVGVQGQPGVTQEGWAVPGSADVTPFGAPKMPDILNKDVQDARLRIAREGRSSNIQINNPMRETFKDEQALRKEYTDASKDYTQLSEGYGKVRGALAADPTRSAPATLAAATQFMKMLDPSSVVRESELGMALSAAGLWDRFTNLHNTVQHGKVLTPSQAQEIGRIADVVYESANRGQQARVKHYRDLSSSYNFDPNRVVPDLSPRSPARPPADAITQQATTFPTPSQQAIGRLKMRPAEKAQFEAVFGPGSADRYLKK
jgi:hypothetical protein